MSVIIGDIAPQPTPMVPHSAWGGLCWRNSSTSVRPPMAQPPWVTTFLRFRYFRSNGIVHQTHLTIACYCYRKYIKTWKKNNNGNNTITTLNPFIKHDLNAGSNVKRASKILSSPLEPCCSVFQVRCRFLSHHASLVLLWRHKKFPPNNKEKQIEGMKGSCEVSIFLILSESIYLKKSNVIILVDLSRNLRCSWPQSRKIHDKNILYK